ncbi:uncharacterized [Tachysurus ichikawai]
MHACNADRSQSNVFDTQGAGRGCLSAKRETGVSVYEGSAKAGMAMSRPRVLEKLLSDSEMQIQFIEK